MHATRTALGLGGLSLLFAMIGCAHTEPSLKPPKQPEEFVQAPSDDPRFTSPTQYPKGTLFVDSIKQKREAAKDDMPGTKGGGGMGRGPGGY